MPESFHYKELATNFLDLLAFLLVTPELVRFVNPAIKKWVQYAIHIVISMVAWSPFILLTEWLRRTGHIPEDKSMGQMGFLLIFTVVFMSTAFFTAYIVFTREKRRVDLFSDAVARKAFAIGLGLFLAARAIAFVYSVTEIIVAHT
jgi:Protein of unknown function (DUF3021)